MRDGLFSDELVLEEWNIRAFPQIAPRYEALVLSNDAGVAVDESQIAMDLEQVAGMDRIKSLVIRYNSRVKNLTFLRALPGLEYIQLNGRYLESLSGLQEFRHGKFIAINTEKNRKRTIGEIAETTVTRLVLHWANPRDLDAIARSQTIEHLDLWNCPPLPFDQWRGVPIHTLSLWNGKLDAIVDSAQLGLRKLSLCGHRHLTGFFGDNTGITRLVVQDCNQLTWRTVSTLKSLEYFTAVSTKTEIPISVFCGLGHLREVALNQCRFQLDVMDLKSSASRLERVLIGGLQKDAGLELSRCNHGVLVTNGKWAYLDGVAVEAGHTKSASQSAPL